MKRLTNEDMLTASREIPLEHNLLIAYTKLQSKRLLEMNPKLAELLALIGERAEGVHEEIALYSLLEFRLYITSILLILLRSIEVAESREASQFVEQSDPTLVANELFARIARKPTS